MLSVLNSIKKSIGVSVLLLCWFAAHSSAATFDQETLTEVVLEYEDGAYLVQLGNYSVIVPSVIFLDSGNDQVTEADRSVLKIGTLVKADISGQNEEGLLEAASFTVYQGEGLETALEALDEDSRLRIGDTMQRIANTSVSATQTETAGAENETSSDETSSLTFENGVWKN